MSGYLVLTDTIVKRLVYEHLRDDPSCHAKNMLLVCKAFNASYSELFSNSFASSMMAGALPHRVIGELVIDVVSRHVTVGCHRLTIECGMPLYELKKVMDGVFSSPSRVTPHTVSMWISLSSLTSLLPSGAEPHGFSVYESVRELTITDYIDDNDCQDVSVACMFQDALLSLFPQLYKLTLVGHSRNNPLWINMDKLTGLRVLDISSHTKVVIAKFPPNLRDMNWTFPTTAYSLYYTSAADNGFSGDILRYEEVAKPKFPTRLKSAIILQRDDQDVLDGWSIKGLETLKIDAFPGTNIDASEFVRERFAKTLNFAQLQSNLKVLVLNGPCDVREIFKGDNSGVRHGTSYVFGNVEKFVMNEGSWRREEAEDADARDEVEVYHKRFDNLFQVFPILKHLSITVGYFLERVDLLGKQTDDGSKVFSLNSLEVSFKYRGTLSLGRNDEVHIGHLKTSSECHDIIFSSPGEIVGWTPSNITIKSANVDIRAYHKIKDFIDESIEGAYTPHQHHHHTHSPRPQVFIETFGRDHPDMNLIVNKRVYLTLSYRFSGEFQSEITEELFLDGDNRTWGAFDVTRAVHKSLRRIYLMSPNVSLKFDEEEDEKGVPIELVIPESFEVPKDYLQNKRVKITRVKSKWLRKFCEESQR